MKEDFLTTIFKCALALATSFALTVLPGIAFAQGGNVMPATAHSHGFSLEDMATKLAPFDASGNNMQYYPQTPFQVLFISNSSGTTVTCPDQGSGLLFTGTNAFVVSSGTPFFVPLFSFDDSPPVIPVFPAQHSLAGNYVFDPLQVGGRDFEVIVDGSSTKIGPEYVAGPITSATPLPDTATHLIQLGVFLTPMSVGTHVVTIKGQIAGAGVFPTIGQHCLQEDFDYLVKVVPGHSKP
jgi:hypothetical protein